MSDRDTLDVLRQAAVWFEPRPDGFGPLLDAIGDARLVLIGGASLEPAYFEGAFARARIVTAR
jgi:hypothetical protein